MKNGLLPCSRVELLGSSSAFPVGRGSEVSNPSMKCMESRVSQG